MSERKWVWMIGMSDASDERLLEWAQSFARPPSLRVRGARLQDYLPERRAHRLVLEGPRVAITIEPEIHCVHPVFELVGAPKTLSGVTLAGRRLDTERYAWDGHTFWLAAEITETTTLQLEFADSP